MDNNFESLLNECKTSVERFVYYRLPSKFDADDILQEVYITAYRKFDTLKNIDTFKAWILSIARNKCNDYFRERAKILTIPYEELTESVLVQGRFGITESTVVSETLENLGDRDKQILYLYFFRELPQAEIAKRLDIPLGTVKSRLHTAKQNFKELYPYSPKQAKGDFIMTKLPEYIPEYKITKSEKEPFPVKWEEIMGWFLVPKLGEKLTWGMYDFPEKKLTEYDEMKVIGKAQVHGIEGVEVVSIAHNPMDSNAIDNNPEVERHFVAQLTDTHCRLLAESHTSGGIKRFYTFLDGDAFLDNWGFGEDNCGNEVNIAPKGDITKNGSEIKSVDKPYLFDVVGRCTVEIGGKAYDTICVMDIEKYDTGVTTEQYLDSNGRTILWRRFNRDDWNFSRYKQKWSEKLPTNERITVNGETYVHWYDCITDYIL